ncbi:MAG: hypothetical protein O7B26_02320, partial [Planctomycetota bacterium]|nr:hypothetical protein [Planctomycetota bacterium]
IGTTALPGFKFIGLPGSMSGASAAGAGDFDSDGFDDIVIAAPNEEREFGGTMRRGVAYLIFGGPHLANRTVRPVGSGLQDDLGQQVAGTIFVSPYESGSIDEAALETASGIGDVDDDGFDDIMIGAPSANFIDPGDPTQRKFNAGQCYLIHGTNNGRIP